MLCTFSEKPFTIKKKSKGCDKPIFMSSNWKLLNIYNFIILINNYHFYVQVNVYSIF